MSAADPSSQAGAVPPAATPLSPSYVQGALWLLLLIYTLNFLDRQIVNILAVPIKEEFNLTNSQWGLLVGIAFAFVYTVLGIPIARYADRFSSNRVTIISCALAVWSAFTVACGLAQNFAQLLIARIGVGVGEAGCTPPAHSLIADKAPPEKRASALAFYSMGVPIGSFFAFAFGGWIAQELNWRWALFLVGAPGILLALVTLFYLKEPRRLGLIPAPKADAPKMGFFQAVKALGGIPSYWYACFAASVLAFIGYGQIAFFSLFYAHAHQLPLAQIGLALAFVVGIAGALGTYAGGQIADRAAQRDTRAYFSVPAIAMVAATPFFLAAMFVPGGPAGLSGGWTDGTLLSLVLLAIPTFLNSLWYGPVYASIQGVVSPQLRASAVAIMLFIVNMVGLGLGPTALGISVDLLSDWQLSLHGLAASGGFNATCMPILADMRLVATGAAEAQNLAAANPDLAAACLAARDEGLRWGLTVSGLAGILAVVLFWMARNTIRADIAKAQAAA